MIIKTYAYPRAGLIGNPSDGYFGKTISFVFSNFKAEITLYESPELEIVPNTRDHTRFESIEQLVRDVKLFGYYGGIRLLKATIKRFFDYCKKNGFKLENKNFTMRYNTNIPTQVGLAGSSAIITAAMKALMQFYNVDIPKPILPNIILEVETKELGISAGLQDRVAQVFGGVTYMDFNKELMEKQGYGYYENIPAKHLPSLYIAYRTELSESSEVFHNDIRARFERGEPEVVNAMKFWAALAEEVKNRLLSGKGSTIGELLNANFDMRRKIYKISQGNIEMVELARSTGASAKFSGSGGAIVGTYTDDAMFKKLSEALAKINITTIKPIIVEEN